MTTEQKKETVVERKLSVPHMSETDYETKTSGPLYIDPKHKLTGYVYKFVSALPGGIEAEERIGWVVVQDEFQVGDVKSNTSTRFGSAVTVQSRCGQLLVLMATTEENFNNYMKYRDKKSKEREKSLGIVEGIPQEYQYGNITTKLK